MPIGVLCLRARISRLLVPRKRSESGAVGRVSKEERFRLYWRTLDRFPCMGSYELIMAIETWFPLAIYYEDLFDAPAYRQELLAAVLELEQQGNPRRAHPGMAWTGDIHGVHQIHHDARFNWIVAQIELHTQIYLQDLGVDLTCVDLYVQRSWPIVTRPQEEIGAHCHHTAHISGVYYIAVPTTQTEDPGSLVFFNDARVNEVCPGLGSENTDIIDPDSYLNQISVAYPPVEGRLLLFPAKQRHAVTINATTEMRVSLSFDLAISAPENTIAGTYEFLTPPPSQWLRLGIN
jgi:uncharacterized protein (TIGR02466 family)